MKLSKDNPLLTAYALGELGPARAAEVASAILADESLRAEVDGIRALAEELAGEFAAEPMGRLSDFQRATLAQCAAEIDRAAISRAAPAGRRRRWLAVAAAVLLAAGAAGLWALLRPPVPTGTNVAQHYPIPQPAPNVPASLLYPLGLTPMPTPAYVDDGGFFESWHPSVGSAAMRPDATQSLPSQAGPSEDSPFRAAAELPASTFGLNVDNASYRHVYQLIIDDGRLPEPSSVRIEEMINYFPYDYAPPAGSETEALTVRADVVQCPWAAGHVLLRVVLLARPGEGRAWNPPEIIARDARVRVVFNPAAVASWRLIGFDGPVSGPAAGPGGLIAAGRSLTVLYELVPAGAAPAASICTVRAEYRLPGEVRLRQLTLRAAGGPAGRFQDASADFRFAATVAGFGMILRNSSYKGTCRAAGMLDAAEASLGDDRTGRRSEFIGVLREACNLLPAE